MSTRAANSSHKLGWVDGDYLRSLFHGAGIAIIACDSEGNIQACNASASKLFAGKGTLEPNRPVSEVFPNKDQQRVADMVANCLATLQAGEYQTRLGGNDVEPLEFAVFCTPVVEPDGTLRGVSLWLRDITRRKRQLRTWRKNERLAHLEKLSGAVAHHYNNLLCSVATSIEYAANMNTISAMRRALQRTVEAISRGSDMTRRLLAFAQGDHRDLDQADLTETVLYYFDQNEERLVREKIELDLEWEPVPVCPIPRERTYTVLDNLVENAVEAMPNGGKLTVRLDRRDEESVLLSIQDTGEGMAPEDLEHVFEPFYTSKGVLGAALSTNPGLGLAVVHGFVREMHGTIAALNAPSGGARFEIVLPIRKSK